MFCFFGLPPLAPNGPFPRAIFHGICDGLCTSSSLQKRAVFLPPGGGRRQGARPPIAKAKATPHAMRSNMPGIRCLVHRRIIAVLLQYYSTPVPLCTTKYYSSTTPALLCSTKCYSSTSLYYKVQTGTTKYYKTIPALQSSLPVPVVPHKGVAEVSRRGKL